MARAAAPPVRSAAVVPAGRGIRWDRVGRVAMLCVLVVILLLYVAPVRQYLAQSQTASEHRNEMRALEAENAGLERRAADLRRPRSLEREARRLGMVKQGERAYVIEDAPASRR